MLTQPIKDRYVKRAVKHQKADEIEKGHYWDGRKGCCVGCLAHKETGAHRFLESEGLGPEWLHRIADTIHEGLPEEKMKVWPVRYVKALPVGLSYAEYDEQVKAPLLVFILRSALETFDHDKFPDVKSVIDGSIALWQRDDVGSKEFLYATAAAYAAAYAAYAAYAATAATAAAYAAYAAAAAAYAAYAATDATDATAAAYAATAAAYAATAAAYAAAYAAADAADAADAAYAAAYEKFADELIRLLEGAE